MLKNVDLELPLNNAIFSLSEYRISTNNKNIVVSYQNWGEVAAEEFSLFLKHQIELNHIEINRYAQMWEELAVDNSPVRSIVNNHVIGVNEDFYDFIIWKKLTTKPVKEARLIGDILGYYQVDIESCCRG